MPALPTDRPLILLTIVLPVILLLVFWSPLLLDLPLVDPSDGIHASCSLRMVESGDWVVPYFGLEPFLDRSVLFTWVQAASLAIFGASEDAARIPYSLFATLTVLVLVLVGKRMFDSRVGILAGIIYATMFYPMGLTLASPNDVTLIVWIVLAYWLFWEMDHAETIRGRLLLGGITGLVLGLSILNKGFVGIGLVGVGYLPYLVLRRRWWYPSILSGGALSLVVALLVALPWYFMVESRIPGFLYYFFYERHVLGMVSDTQRHGDSPWWYYFPILLGGASPWLFYLLTMRRSLVRMLRGEISPASPESAAPSPEETVSDDSAALRQRTALWLCICWIAADTVLLTLAGSKLVNYIWPVFPPLAMLLGVLWQRILARSARQWELRESSLLFMGLCFLGIFTLPLLTMYAQFEINLLLGAFDWFLLGLVSLAALIPCFFWQKKQWTVAFILGALLIATQFCTVLMRFGPLVASRFTPREMVMKLNELESLPPQVVFVRDRLGSIYFYLTPEKRAELEKDTIFTIGTEESRRLRRVDPESLIVVPEKELQEVEEAWDLDGISYREWGRYRVYLAEEIVEKNDRFADFPPLEAEK